MNITKDSQMFSHLVLKWCGYFMLTILVISCSNNRQTGTITSTQVTVADKPSEIGSVVEKLTKCS